MHLSIRRSAWIAVSCFAIAAAPLVRADVGHGEGLYARGEASRLDVERAALSSLGSVGVLATGGAEIEARHLSVRGVRSIDSQWGMGVAAYDQGHLSLFEFRIERPDLCGVHVGEGGRLTLGRGEVRDATVGVCVQEPSFEIDALAEVRMVETTTPIDSVLLPVPSLLAPPTEGGGSDGAALPSLL